MSQEPLGNGDNIEVGDIHHSQGVAIGRHVSVRVQGDNVTQEDVTSNAELRHVLEELYDLLGQAQLPRESIRSAQTEVGTALQSATASDSAGVVAHVQRAGETIKQAKIVVEEGTTLGQSIVKLAKILGSVAGGARVVGSWFGLTL